MEAQPAGKKTKKVLVKRLVTMTKAQIDFIKDSRQWPHIPARPGTSPKTRNTRLAYNEALVDQQEKFGYAVDESEAEVTDDEDEFEDDDDDGTMLRLDEKLVTR
jgi:hypothetical protein